MPRALWAQLYGCDADPSREMNSVWAPTGDLVDQIEAGLSENPGPGGWSGGFANQAHWDPTRPLEWRCWAQSGPTWSAHCGAEVPAQDALGLCQRHRRALLERDPNSTYPELEGLADPENGPAGDIAGASTPAGAELVDAASGGPVGQVRPAYHVS